MAFPGDIAQLLLNCFETELDSGPNPPGAGVCLRVGEVPFDVSPVDLCCAGFGWVRIVRIYPSVNFPNPVNEPQTCIRDSYAIELEMGALRCHTGDTCESWTAEFLQVDEDAAAMRRALCCFPEVLEEFGSPVFVAGEWAPIDGQGGCLGGTMTVTVSASCSEC